MGYSSSSQPPCFSVWHRVTWELVSVCIRCARTPPLPLGSRARRTWTVHNLFPCIFPDKPYFPFIPPVLAAPCWKDTNPKVNSQMMEHTLTGPLTLKQMKTCTITKQYGNILVPTAILWGQRVALNIRTPDLRT